MADLLRFWSVTSLLKLGLGTSDALVNWAVRTTAEYAVDNHDVVAPLATRDRDAAIKLLADARWQTSGKAATRGTDLHKAAEQLALGQTPDVDPNILPYVEQYRSFLADHKPRFLMSEAPVYNPDFLYAGTCDGIMELGGTPVVFDIKTTDKHPDSGKSRPPYAEVALQLCAYRRATEVGVLAEQRYDGGRRYYLYNPDGSHQPMPDTAGAVCIVVSPYDYMVVPVRTDDVVWRSFRAVLATARWQVEHSRNVFGPLVTPTRQEAAA